MDENRITLSAGLVQAIGDYLVTRPYREVVQLLNALQAEVQASSKLNGATRPSTAQPEEATP